MCCYSNSVCRATRTLVLCYSDSSDHQTINILGLINVAH